MSVDTTFVQPRWLAAPLHHALLALEAGGDEALEATRMSAPDGENTAPETETDDDAAAQEALANAAAQEADGGEDDGDDEGLDPKVKAKIDKANREARNLRERLKALDPIVKAAKAREDKEKTESQRLTDQLAEREKELHELRTGALRREAAEAAGLPAKFVKFITASDADDALAQAKELAKELKGVSEPAKKPDLRQGQRGAPAQGSQNQDDLIRFMAGRQ